jgi:serine/threonine protein kinase
LNNINLGLIYKKGVAVEPIIGKANKKELSEISKLLDKVEFKILKHYDQKVNVKSKDDFIMVKSNTCGIAYSLKLLHSDRKVITLEQLIENKSRNQLTNFQKTSIIRQIVNIITEVWDVGVVHRHPHIGNWAIDFGKGVLMVRLIDFDLCYDVSKVGPDLGKDEVTSSNLVWSFSRNIS